MISSIVMKDFAVYEDTKLSPCRRINLIYGSNGTGKTILSNYLSDPSQRQYRNFSITWDDQKPIPVYVFNRRFCDEHFGNTSIPGIYTLGKENADIEREADELGDRIDTAEKDLFRLHSEYRNADNKKQVKKNFFIDTVWEKSKTYKQLFGDFFSRPGSKTNCFDKVQFTIRQGTTVTANLLDIKNKADLLHSQKTVQYPVYRFPDPSPMISTENDPVWSTEEKSDENPKNRTVSASFEINDWIRQGLNYVKNDRSCPFCGQEIRTEVLINKMKDLANDKHGHTAEYCGRLLQQYRSDVQRFIADTDSIYKRNRDNGEAFLDVNQFGDTLTNLRNLFHTNILFMQQKRNIPSDPVKIQSSGQMIDNLRRMINESNERASQANQLLKDANKGIKALKDETWNSFCRECETELQAYKASVCSYDEELSILQRQIDTAESQVKSLTTEREQVLRQAVNIRQTVDDINNDLSSLGFNNFRLKLIDNDSRYAILRENGLPARETLSEGEKTLIMLLYFFRMIEGASSKDKLRAERIVVIDDPVSNLDDHTLNAVLGKIALLITRILNGDKFIRQIFVLSHRKECTRYLRNCDARVEDEQYSALWILQKKNGKTLAKEFSIVM